MPCWSDHTMHRIRLICHRTNVTVLLLFASLIMIAHGLDCQRGTFVKYCRCNKEYECSVDSSDFKITMTYDTTAQVLAVLDEGDSDNQLQPLDELPDDFFTEETAAQQMKSVAWLSFSTRRLRTVNSQKIGGCLSLKRLDITSCTEFYSLSSDIVNECEQLERLFIEGTELVSLPELESFSGCKLNVLALRNNSIKDIPASFVIECSQDLSMIDLAFNRLTSIPDSFFSASKKLLSINLEGNRLSALPDRFLKECQALQELILNSNQLQEIPNDIFPHKDSSLRFLYFKNNSLTHWPPNILSNTDMLEELDLSFNKLATLTRGSLGKCHRLRRLNLESNAIQNLLPELLDNCTDLFELNLKGNHIATLPENFLSVCPSLTALSLDTNDIETIPTKFMQKCLKVEYVSMTKNKLKRIDSSLFLEGHRLRTIKLNKNALKQLPSMLTGNTTFLELLDVSENHIDSVTAMQFMVAEIKSMGTVYNLSYNMLDELQIGTFKFSNLPTELDLSHNIISQLHEGWTVGLQKLVKLNLSYNKLTNLSTRQLMLLDNLKELYLVHNLITNVETDAFVHLSNLVRFDFSQNAINFEDFSSPFIPERVEFLNASFNKFSHFPMTWIKLPTLSTVDISHNLIMQNDLTRLLITYPKNKVNNRPTIYVAGNKIHCDCEILAVTNKLNAKLDIKDLNAENCSLKENVTSPSCSNINGCPKECQCGRNENGATFVDCKDYLLQTLPSREPFVVTMLDISDSNITDIGSLCDPSWRNLTHLMASNAFFLEKSTELMQKLCLHHLTSLTVLDLAMNNITALPDDFLSGLNSLGNFNLSRNPFIDFPVNFFKNSTSMKLVDLSFTNITDIGKEMFGGLINLVKLYLTGNNIRTISADTFMPLVSLTQLYLNNNSIDTLSNQIFRKLTNLTLLDLDSNNLSMSRIFDLPPSLVVLRLSNNNITGELQSTKLPSQMTTLDIRNNFLKRITITIEDFEDVFLNFHLEANQIEQILLDVSYSNASRKTMIKLYLMNNPIVCDCTITNLIKLVSHKNVKLRIKNTNLFIVADDVKCKRPIFLKDKLLNELSVDDLLCESKDSCPNECWCYNNKSNGIILDCHEQPMKSLPSRIPRNVRVLYINKLNNSIASLEPLNQPQWSNITELWMENCCQNMKTLNVTVLNKLHNLEVVEINENCKCKANENIRFSPTGIHGPCKLQLPAPFCRQNNDNEWIWRECTSNFFPPPYSKPPMCYIECKQCLCYLNTKYEVVMNCSNMRMTDLPSIRPSNVNILDMSNNNLLVLKGVNNWTTLTELYLTNNTLAELKDLTLPSMLKIVDLRFNHLKKPTGWLDVILSTEITTFQPYVFLSNNTWICSCEPLSFNQGISTKLLQYVKDINATYCLKDDDLKPLMKAFQCPTISERVSLAIGLSVGILILAAIIIGTVVYFWQAKPIKIWLFAHRWCLCLIKEESLDDDKEFDAFISYSSEDSTFIAEILLPGLEDNEDPRFRYKVCIHERDWLGGGYIPQQIIQSVQISRRTIIVLSAHFLQSSWANLEFKAAFQQALTDRINRIIVIVPDEVPPKDDMDSDLKMYISMNSYIRYKEGRFWDKLHYAMPHKIPGASIRHLPADFIKMVRQESESKNCILQREESNTP